MVSLSVLFALCLASAFAHAELNERTLVRGSYEDVEADRNVHHYFIEKVSTTMIHGVDYAQLFTSEDNWFLGTSWFDDGLTHNGKFPILKFDAEESTFEEVALHPQLRPTSMDVGSVVKYFTTIDKKVWAYDALISVENSTMRSRKEISRNGTSYIFAWAGDKWDETPVLTYKTYGSTTESDYFTTPDGREFLWTASFGNDTYDKTRGAERCILIEYASGKWTIVNDNSVLCGKAPLAPLAFTNVKDQFVVMQPSYGTPKQGGSVNTKAAGPTWYEYKNKVFEWVDLFDNFGTPDALSVYHMVDEAKEAGGFDHIVVHQRDGVATYRLWWESHQVEELPFVRADFPSAHFSWINIGALKCFILSNADKTYPGRNQGLPNPEDSHFPVWCWDGAHDNWDLTLRVPAEGAWFVHSFVADDRTFIVSIEDGHHQTWSVQVMEVMERDPSMKHIWVDFLGSPSTLELQRNLESVGVLAMIFQALQITVLVLVILTFFIAVALFVGGRGGGGSTDYTSM